MYLGCRPKFFLPGFLFYSFPLVSIYIWGILGFGESDTNFLRVILRETCSLCRNLSILYSYFKLVDFSSPLPVVFPDLGFPRKS